MNAIFVKAHADEGKRRGPPSLVNSTGRPNARCRARCAASTAGESTGEKQGRTPGPLKVTAAWIPGGVRSATYSRSAVATSAGSW